MRALTNPLALALFLFSPLCVSQSSQIIIKTRNRSRFARSKNTKAGYTLVDLAISLDIAKAKCCCHKKCFCFELRSTQRPFLPYFQTTYLKRRKNLDFKIKKKLTNQPSSYQNHNISSQESARGERE